MKKSLIFVLAVAQVVFAANIHCANCAKKVQENIAFEKGVKDLKVSVDEKTITVTFDTAKTDTTRLSNAISKLGYKNHVVSYKETAKKKK